MGEQRDNSGRLIVDFHGINAGRYVTITEEIVRRFELSPAGARISGFDEVFQEFQKGNKVLSLEWDNWSGYTVNAKTESAELLVREISCFISATFNV